MPIFHADRARGRWTSLLRQTLLNSVVLFLHCRPLHTVRSYVRNPRSKHQSHWHLSDTESTSPHVSREKVHSHSCRPFSSSRLSKWVHSRLSLFEQLEGTRPPTSTNSYRYVLTSLVTRARLTRDLQERRHDFSLRVLGAVKEWYKREDLLYYAYTCASIA
jgi:hypothetical protein